MRIKTTGENLRDEVRFSSLFPQKATEQQVKQFDRDGKVEIKTSPDGRPVHRTALKALRLVDGVPVGEDRGVSLSVIERSDIVAGKIYELVGTVWVTPYESNGRVAVSVIAEGVKEVAAPSPKFNVGGHNG